jgi:cupin fold WbuC family metalloprotein
MLKSFTAKNLQQLSDKARQADRMRANLNVHESLDADVQRLFIATEPGTYIRPHRHSAAHKWEFFMVIMGEIDLLIFDDEGTLCQRIVMAPDQTRAIELPAKTWHSYVCKKTGTVALEVKQGAYIPTPETDFASWAPAENSAEAADYLRWMSEAQPV